MATEREFSRLLATAVQQIKTHRNFQSSHLYAGINPVGNFFDDLFKAAGGRINYNANIGGRKDLEKLAKSMYGQSGMSILASIQKLFPSSGMTLSQRGKDDILQLAKAALAKKYAGGQGMTARQRMIANISGAIAAAEHSFAALNPELAKKASYKEMYGDFWEDAWNADKLAGKRSRVKEYTAARRKAGWRSDRQFHLDMMDDYDRQREEYAESYGSYRKADAVMRKNVLRQLPEFFKNSKRSTKELYKIAGYAKVFPRVAKLAQFGAAHPALLAAQGIRMAYQYGMKNLMESVGSYVSATASGLSYSGAIFGGSALSGFGGSAADRFASAGSWYGNVGEILMGGGIEKLVALDRFGINPMGSGSGGFATEEEILVRIAKQLPKWDKSRQLALKNNPMIKISDPMFAAMLAHPNDFQQYLHRNDYMKAWGVGDEEVPAAGIRQATKWGDANAAWSGFGGQVGLAFESTSDILADLWKGAGLASTKGMQWFNKADRAFTGVWKDFWFNWFDGPSNERSILHAIFGSDNPSNAAKNAAVSSDVYDSNGGSAGSQTTNDNSRSVTINVNGMTVQSNNAEGVVKGLADMSGTYDPTALATANDPGGY